MHLPAYEHPHPSARPQRQVAALSSSYRSEAQWCYANCTQRCNDGCFARALAECEDERLAAEAAAAASPGALSPPQAVTDYNNCTITNTTACLAQCAAECLVDCSNATAARFAAISLAEQVTAM